MEWWDVFLFSTLRTSLNTRNKKALRKTRPHIFRFSSESQTESSPRKARFFLNIRWRTWGCSSSRRKTTNPWRRSKQRSSRRMDPSPIFASNQSPRPMECRSLLIHQPQLPPRSSRISPRFTSWCRPSSPRQRITLTIDPLGWLVMTGQPEEIEESETGELLVVRDIRARTSWRIPRQCSKCFSPDACYSIHTYLYVPALFQSSKVDSFLLSILCSLYVAPLLIICCTVRSIM